MKINEMIAVLQAAHEGRTIQFKSKWHDEWVVCSDPKFNFGELDYRVGPRPREFWINMYTGRPSTHTTKESSNKYEAERDEVIHVREVME